MWGIPLGGPPRDPTAPPGVPGCHRVLEKIAKILNNYIKIVHTSKYISAAKGEIVCGKLALLCQPAQEHPISQIFSKHL